MNIDLHFNSLEELLTFAKTITPKDSETSAEAATIIDNPAEGRTVIEAESTAKEKKPAEPDPEPKQKEKEPAKPEHSAADLRRLLFELNRKATGDQAMTVNRAKEVIGAVGYSAFKDVPEEKYNELYAKAEAALKELDNAR
jgi:hypothetical protein